MKAIIYVDLKNPRPPARYHDYVWSEKHKCHIWRGLELNPEEFNRLAGTPLRIEDAYPRPSVKIIEDSADAKPSLEAVPFEELAATYRTRSKAIKAKQLADARAAKAAKKAAKAAEPLAVA